MAKIDKSNVKLKKTNKRKIKEMLESESPTSKFKKLDISMTKTKKTKLIEKIAVTSDSMSSPKKRKSSEDTEISISGKKTKFSKTKIDSQESVNDELQEPSLHEIHESLKPENIKNIETVRQKKRAKHQKVVEVNKQDSLQREIQRNIDYLNKWKSNRELWKFEKLRQISIQNHLFDEGNMNCDELWSLTLEYLSGTKGGARELILKSAEGIINDIESRLNETNKKEILSLKNYKRAREMIQLLQ